MLIANQTFHLISTSYPYEAPNKFHTPSLTPTPRTTLPFTDSHNTKDGDEETPFPLSLTFPNGYVLHHHHFSSNPSTITILIPHRYHQDPQKSRRLHHSNPSSHHNTGLNPDQRPTPQLKQRLNSVCTKRQCLPKPQTWLPQLPKRPAEERAHPIPRAAHVCFHLKLRHSEQPRENTGW